MNVLVTAGNTMTMIDQVRGISNIFRGHTGNTIAERLSIAGHRVMLLTSQPSEVITNEWIFQKIKEGEFGVHAYKTYDQLRELMHKQICSGTFDLIIHSAAVSDYKVEGTFVPDPTAEITDDRRVVVPLPPAGKISSSHEELFLRCVPTEKIIDKIRRDWGYKGKLVKFKLQVGKTDEELLEIARKSRAHSDADLIVANCLAWAKERAYVIGRDDVAHSVTRVKIASAILERLS